MNLADEMKALLDAFYASFETGDGSEFLESFAQDVLVIGTDEVEWWKGKPDVQRVIEAQLEEMRSGGVRVTGDDDVDVGVHGDVVWAAGRLTVHLADGTETLMRLTAVAVREADTLSLRQMHASLGTPNEEVVQQQLTV